MSDRQLKLMTTDNIGDRNVRTTTINNVNPEATGANMLTYAKMLNRFTTNVYGQTNLVETTNLDTDTVKAQGKLAFKSLTGVVEGNNIRLDVTHSSGVTFGYAYSSGQRYFIDYSPSTGVAIMGANTPGTYSVYIGGTETSTNYSNAIEGQVTVTA